MGKLQLIYHYKLNITAVSKQNYPSSLLDNTH